MAFVITEACVDVKDMTCVDNCPVDCIYEGNRMVYIQPDECIDCGACAPVCPQEAIYFEPDLPRDVVRYKTINANFFAEIGSPGGAANVDYGDLDHPDVVTLPPRSTR